MPLTPLLKRHEIANDQIVKVNVLGNDIIVVENDGNPIAYSAVCPHQGADLSLGKIEDGKIVCAMHEMRFSCADGTSSDIDKCLIPLPIIEKEGALFIDSKHLAEIDEPSEIKLLQFKDLPSPKGKPLVGHLPEFKSDRKHLVLENWAKEVGNVYRISLMGKKIMVSGDPVINLQMQKKRPDKFRRYSKIQEIMEEMDIYGTFSLEGDKWAMHRKLTTDALSQKNVKGYFPTTVNMTKRLFNRWSRNIGSGEAVDVQKEMMRFTVDVTTSIAFGYDGNTLDNEGDVIQNHLDKIFPMINKRIASPIPFWRIVKSKKDKELDHALSEIRSTIQKYIDEAKLKLKENPSLKLNPTNFLEALLVEQENEGEFGDKDVYGNVFTILLAGEDTTSNSISWALYYLAKYPEVLAKVREEIDTVNFEGTCIETYEDLDKLPYMEAVINESMRLKPVGPIGYTQALEDIVIDEYFIKKDTIIFLLTRTYQIDDKNFLNAEEFIPERWLKVASGCPMSPHNPVMHRPFGSGSRFCPGKALAFQEIKMALAMVCKNFSFKFAVNADEVNEVSSFTMSPENLLLNITPR